MPTSSAPPPLDAGPRLWRRHYALTLGVLFLAGLGLRLAAGERVPLPGCGFRWLTGLPCPFCGSTRCLAALSRLDLLAGFRWNPLAAVAVVGVCLWAVLGLIVPERLGRGLGAWRAAGGGAWRFLLLGALAANWVYLLFRLPR